MVEEEEVVVQVAKLMVALALGVEESHVKGADAVVVVAVFAGENSVL